jgi:hypothetical protein
MRRRERHAAHDRRLAHVGMIDPPADEPLAHNQRHAQS